MSCIVVSGCCIASGSDYSDEGYGLSLAERLLAAEHLISVGNPQEVQSLFTASELEADMGALYFAGLSRLMTGQDPDEGARFVEQSALNGYSDAINLIRLECNMEVPRKPSPQVEHALRELFC